MFAFFLCEVCLFHCIITITTPLQIDRIRTTMFPPDDDDVHHVQLAVAAAAAVDSCCSCLRHRFTAGSAIGICRLAEDICLECLGLFKMSLAVGAAHGGGVREEAAAGGGGVREEAAAGGDRSDMRPSLSAVEATLPSSLPSSSAPLPAAAVPSSFAPRSLSSGDTPASLKSSGMPLLSDDGFDRLLLMSFSVIDIVCYRRNDSGIRNDSCVTCCCWWWCMLCANLLLYPPSQHRHCSHRSAPITVVFMLM
jgi:hypothetical protein